MSAKKATLYRGFRYCSIIFTAIMDHHYFIQRTLADMLAMILWDWSAWNLRTIGATEVDVSCFFFWTSYIQDFADTSRMVISDKPASASIFSFFAKFLCHWSAGYISPITELSKATKKLCFPISPVIESWPMAFFPTQRWGSRERGTWGILPK